MRRGVFPGAQRTASRNWRQRRSRSLRSKIACLTSTLGGDFPAVYDNKNHELERSAADSIGTHRWKLETELIHTLRILSRSHGRLLTNRRSGCSAPSSKPPVCTTRLVELDLYVNPVQNYQWKYRQQLKPSAQRAGFLESLQVQFFPGIHTSAPSRYHLTE